MFYKLTKIVAEGEVLKIRNIVKGEGKGACERKKGLEGSNTGYFET